MPIETHDTLLRKFEKHFNSREPILKKDPAWEKHITTDVAKIMVEYLGERYRFTKEEQRKVLQEYMKAEDEYLDVCDWVTKMQTDTIASLLATITKNLYNPRLKC